MFLNLIYLLDFFKIPITFSCRGRSRLNTRLGGFISVFIITYLLYGFFTSNMVKKINPYINIQNIMKTPHPNLLLSKNNFDIFTVLQNINGTNIVEPTIFNFVAIIKTIDTMTGNSTVYNEQTMRLCTQDDFLVEKMNSTPWNGGYCFDYENLEIEGFWTTETMKYLQIQLKRCKNNTYPGIVCKSDEEITKFLTSSTFGFNFYFTDKTFDLDNLEKPIKTIFTNKYTIMNQQMFKYIDYFIKKVVLINDEEYILENAKSEEAFIYSHAEVETKIRGDDPDDVLSIANFFSDQNTQYMVRRYQKLSEIVAQLGGMGGVFVSLSIIFLNWYTHFMFSVEMANNTYTFQKINERKKNKASQKKEEVKKRRENKGSSLLKFHQLEKIPTLIKKPIITETITETKNISKIEVKDVPLEEKKKENEKAFRIEPKILPISEEEVNFEESLNPVEENRKQRSPKKTFSSLFSIKKKSSSFVRQQTLIEKMRKVNDEEKEERKLRFGFIDFIKFKVKKLFNIKMSKKENLFKMATENIKNDMDIFKLMKKIKEIDRLKVVLMGENNIKLFDFLDDQMIFIDQNEVIDEDKKTGDFKLSKHLIKISNEKQMIDLIKYYNDLKGNLKCSDFEKRLLDLVENKINLLYK